MQTKTKHSLNAISGNKETIWTFDSMELCLKPPQKAY